VSILSRLFGNRQDGRDAVRPIWANIIAIARQRSWYDPLGVEDSMAGRFDMITLVLALVLLRMEREEDLAEPATRLTELFVSDMEGQLRQSGIGDPTVGKHVRKLVTTLGGRLGALREALPDGPAALVPVLERNVTVTADCDHAQLASAIADLQQVINQCSDDQLLSGAITPIQP